MRSIFLSRLLRVALLCGASLTPCIARADAFAPIPAGDPIHRQLSALVLVGEGKTIKSSPGLTRYEAALQVARVAAVAETRPGSLGRSGWRALRDLTLVLGTELRQLGVSTQDVLELCSRQLAAPTARVDVPATSDNTTSRRSGSGLVAPSAPSFLAGTPSPAERRVLQSQLEMPLLQRVRTGAALLALQRDTQDPFSDPSSAFVGARKATRFVGGEASLALKLNSWLRVRAQTSQRVFDGSDAAPSLSAPLFQGATQARGMGAGVELSPLSGLRVSTDYERLSTDRGIRGTRVGGGVGLSAWQNRLSLSAHMSRLQPEDRAVLPATATELKVGVAVRERLSLSLLYQGLFSSQSESSRLAGGLNFSF